MHLSLIQEGEELEKKSVPGPWHVDSRPMIDEWYGNMKQLTTNVSVWGNRERWTDEAENDAQLIVFLRNNAKDLLEAARWAVEHQELCKGEVRINPDGKSITLDISAWNDHGTAPSKAMQMIVEIAKRVMYPPNHS